MLLTKLLQIRNTLSRREVYERELAQMPPPVQASFRALLADTQLELEKALMRGERVDVDLLQQVRVIAIESAEHVPADEVESK